jgi:uncharacterized OB-fold protein
MSTMTVQNETMQNETMQAVTMQTATACVPIVDYLVLEPEPHLRAQQCAACGARFFDRRNACASCSGTQFAAVDVATEGVLRTFSIVSFAPQGVQAPFIAAIVDCAGTSVPGKLLNVPPAPEHVTLGMPVRLATYSLGLDANGVEAIGYGFEPTVLAEPPAPGQSAEPGQSAQDLSAQGQSDQESGSE